MTREQVEELVTRLARPIFIYRMAKGLLGKQPGAEKRMEMAHREIEEAIVSLFGPDLEAEERRPGSDART